MVSGSSILTRVQGWSMLTRRRRQDRQRWCGLSIGFSAPWRRNAVPATCSAGPATVADPPGREGTALSRLAANLSRPRSRRKLADFHDAAVEARRPEVAKKGLALWPAILVALRAQQDEADQPVGCGCHNMINYQHHILSHIVVTRPQNQH